MPLPRRYPIGVGVGDGSHTSTYGPSFSYLSKGARSYMFTDNTSPLDGRAGPSSNANELAARSFVARMPFFAYITMLHLYETLGWWRLSAKTKQVDFAEWNEFHHLLTMESLDGDQLWVDLFLAQHSDIHYFIVLVLLWLPVPRIFKLYYEAEYIFYFDESQPARPRGSRRSQEDSLYDVFMQIRDDEAEHVNTNTMAQCQDRKILVPAPRNEGIVAVAAAVAAAFRSMPQSKINTLMEDFSNAFQENRPAVDFLYEEMQQLAEYLSQFGWEAIPDAWDVIVTIFISLI
ncbi:MAG: hypothetical protein SGPRY_009561 [Prymnesium sp.]